MPEVHAVLSASASKRWLNCPPSARLEQRFPNETSVYAAEGTFCHSKGEAKLRRYLGEKAADPQSDEFDTDEIENISDTYSQFVIGIAEEMKQNMHGIDPLLMVEVRVDYSYLVPGGFGTSDAVLIGRDADGRGVLHIADLKTGRGVYVDVQHNTQLMLYALGALHDYGYLQDIDIVRMSIVQPRLENINTFEMTAADLRSWGESIKPIARLAFEGKGEQKPGDWCRFCRAKAVCKACADEALALTKDEFVDLDSDKVLEDGTGSTGESEDEDINIPDQSEAAEDLYDCDRDTVVMKEPGLLTKEQIERILPTLNRIQNWIEGVFAYVNGEAINHGVKWEGYKVVEGRSRRQFSNTDDVVKACVEAGLPEDSLYKRELLTLTELEKKLGKKRFVSVLGQYVLKPPGKLTVVPVTDPREAVDVGADGVVNTYGNTDAADDFEPL